jgi:hypothetical protein
LPYKDQDPMKVEVISSRGLSLDHDLSSALTGVKYRTFPRLNNPGYGKRPEREITQRKCSALNVQAFQVEEPQLPCIS